MLKKLLLLLIGFACTEMNAQDYIVSEDTGCGGSIREFVSVASPNAWDAYDVMATPDAWGVSEGATATGSTLTIRYSTTNNRWEYLLNGTDVIFIHPSANLNAPATGWVDGPSFHCNPGNTLELRSQIGGVLKVNKNELSAISIYPNPSKDFITISNLKEERRVIITNITGQIIKELSVDKNNNRIDIQDLSKGFYFVSLDNKKTIKFIKQ